MTDMFSPNPSRATGVSSGNRKRGVKLVKGIAISLASVNITGVKRPRDTISHQARQDQHDVYMHRQKYMRMMRKYRHKARRPLTNRGGGILSSLIQPLLKIEEGDEDEVEAEHEEKMEAKESGHGLYVASGEKETEEEEERRHFEWDDAVVITATASSSICNNNGAVQNKHDGDDFHDTDNNRDDDNDDDNGYTADSDFDFDIFYDESLRRYDNDHQGREQTNHIVDQEEVKDENEEDDQEDLLFQQFKANKTEFQTFLRAKRAQQIENLRLETIKHDHERANQEAKDQVAARIANFESNPEWSGHRVLAAVNDLFYDDNWTGIDEIKSIEGGQEYLSKHYLGHHGVCSCWIFRRSDYPGSPCGCSNRGDGLSNFRMSSPMSYQTEDPVEFKHLEYPANHVSDGDDGEDRHPHHQRHLDPRDYEGPGDDGSVQFAICSSSPFLF